MGRVLVLIEHNKGTPIKGSLSALSAAFQVVKQSGGGEVITLSLGTGANVAAQALLGFGVTEAYYSEAPEFDRYLAPNYQAAVNKAFTSCSSTVVVMAATSLGKDLAPRVAAVLEAGQGSDILQINSDGTFKRPMYAGNVFADIEITTQIKVLTIRPTAFAPAVSSGGSGKVLELTGYTLTPNMGEIVSYEVASSDRPELSDAEIVVSGGRALKSAENFMKYVGDLADVFGAAIGASRAAVDSGYAPNDWQVGQTGKVVAPSLYIALGISGAIQHLAGMKDSKVVVAINKDPDAPIFEVADFGLVADLYQAVPELVEEVRKIKA